MMDKIKPETLRKAGAIMRSVGNGNKAALFEAAADRIEELQQMDREAAEFVELPIINRTSFTGKAPYVGWRGLGQALNEALDERDALRIEVERLRSKP